MSGITGIFRRDGKDVDPADIKKMNDKIAHRGPDGSRVWCEGPVAFGHQMLHTTQESLHEILPFEDEESGLVITADARIDNRKDLAPLLGIEDNEYVSDSYFILKAYEKWGEKCPEELLGDFAFAIWDKNKEQLFCARDHMGVKPFFYYCSGVFFFATENKAILSNPEVPCNLNDLRLAFHLLPTYDHQNLTFYQDIYRLPASHLMIIINDKIELKQYWELDPNSEIIFKSDKEYVVAFREIFAKAVKSRLRSASPIGFELSGGLDSSSIVCMANHISKDNDDLINTFSIIFDDIYESDEKPYIDIVQKKCSTKAHFLKADNISPLYGIEDMIWHADGPFKHHNMAIIWKLNEKMNKKGIRVVLGGEFGDNIISHGEKYLSELLWTFKWNKLIEEIIGTSQRLNKTPYSLLYNLLKKNILELIPYDIKKFWWYFRGYRVKPDIYLLNKDFNHNINAKKYVRDHFQSEPNDSKSHHYFLISMNSNQTSLELYDHISGGFSLEYRYPFLDKRLVEFCYSIPTEQKYRFGWDRIIMRRAMNNILPKKVQWRHDKAQFAYFFHRNLLMFNKDHLENLFFTMDENVLLKRYVDLEKVRTIYQNFHEDDYGPNSRDLWSVIGLLIWLKKQN